MANLEAKELTQKIISFILENDGVAKPFHKETFTKWAASRGITFSDEALLGAIRMVLSREILTVHLEGETFVVAQW